MAEFILADILDGDDEDEAVEALLAEVLKRYEFDESKIERHPAGSPEGGRFAPKDGGSSSASTREEHITKLEDAGREWLKSKLNGAEPTRNDLSSMARYLGAEHADKVNAIIKDFDDYSKYPERPAVRLTVGGQGVPDVWLLGWRENEKGLEATPIHDHGNSEAGVYVHKGAVNERIFAINKAEVGQGEIEFREVDRGLDGSAITINAPYLHDIGAQKGAGTSVTIHAYYPPLNEMNFYEIKGSKLIKSGSWKESADTRAAKGFTRDHDFPCFVYSKNKYHDPSEQRFIRAYEWDEDKHPRDELGRWTDTEGALQGNENENGPVPQDSAGTTEGGQRQLPNVPRGAVTHTSPEREKAKSALSGGTIEDVGNLGGGANATELLTLKDADGNEMTAVFKPQDGEYEGLRRDIPGDYYLREAAASEVAEIVGMDDIVPPVVIREIDGRIGSVHEYRNDTLEPAKYRDWALNEVETGEKQRVAAFDYLIGNEDRHGGNWLIEKDGSRIVLIDHGLAFGTDNDYIRSGFADQAYKEEWPVVDAIGDRWDGKWPLLQKTLEKRFDEAVIGAVKSRYDELIAAKNNGRTFADLSISPDV